jgi:hypothetical protein
MEVPAGMQEVSLTTMLDMMRKQAEVDKEEGNSLFGAGA